MLHKCNIKLHTGILKYIKVFRIYFIREHNISVMVDLIVITTSIKAYKIDPTPTTHSRPKLESKHGRCKLIGIYCSPKD